MIENKLLINILLLINKVIARLFALLWFWRAFFNVDLSEMTTVHAPYCDLKENWCFQPSEILGCSTTGHTKNICPAEVDTWLDHYGQHQGCEGNNHDKLPMTNTQRWTY